MKMGMELARNVEAVTDKLAGGIADEDDGIPGSPSWNAALRAIAAQFNDDGRALRKVTHFADPVKGAVPKPEFLTHVGAMGFKQACYDDMPNAIFTEMAATDQVTIDPRTAELQVLCASLGWKYFGWEAEIMQGFDEG